MPDPKRSGALFLFDSSPEGRVLVPSAPTPLAGAYPVSISRDDFEKFAALVADFGDAPMHNATGDRWAALAPDAPIPEGYRFCARRDLPALADYDFFNRSGVAWQAMNLRRKNRFCGACGEVMRDHERDSARVCDACGNVVYPSLSPAIIVAVERDDRLLMGHGVNFPPGRYSVLAGFVEPGETLEEAVAREVFEESKVRVRNIRYFGSQPWPFPNSMMLGFRADWSEGEPEADADELTDVRWFARDELPEMPPSVSIARRLIDDWLMRE